METVKSKNPCPFCGKKEWNIWYLSSYDEWIPMYDEWIPMYVELVPNTRAFVDLTWKESESFDLLKGDSLTARYVDECISCGALVQG